MRAVLLCCVCAVVLSGCASSMKEGRTAAGEYQEDILIGQKRGTVLKAVETVFGEPRQVGAIFEKSDYEVELRRYVFTNVSDFVVYFHKGVFIQAGLMPVGSPEYPPLRGNFQSITSDQPGPVLGYRIFMNNQEVVLDTIMPQNAAQE